MDRSDSGVGCSYCGVNPYVGCKHRPAVGRPIPAEPIEDKVDRRKVSRGQGWSFKIAKERKNVGP